MNSIDSESSNGFAGNQRRSFNSNESNVISLNTASSGGQRKKLNYQTQLSLKSQAAVDDNDGATTKLPSTGRFSPHPNDIFLPQTARLTIPPPFEKFGDTLIAGCLPPPSPAPSSDCLTSNYTQIQSQSNKANQQMQQLNLNQFHHQHGHHSHMYPLPSSNSTSLCNSNSGNAKSQPCTLALAIGDNNRQNKYNLHQGQQSNQRLMSPNSKYRLDRYRDPKANRMESSTAPSKTRYFLPSAKVQCSEAYSSYLGSTVHTPVKRYVPTPPLASELYTDLPLSSSTSVASSSSAAGTSTSFPISTHYLNMPLPLPHNYRATKCCHHPIEESIAHSKSAQTYNGTNNSNLSSPSPNCPCPSPSPASSSGISAVSITATATAPVPTPPPNICSPMVTTKSVSSCNKLRAKSDEGDSVIVIQQTISQSQNQDNTTTCLHCNTARRTTGVHQTTQTTGPISPVPVAMPLVPIKMAPINDLSKIKHHEQELTNTKMTDATFPNQQTKHADNTNKLPTLQRQTHSHQMYASSTMAPSQLIVGSPRNQMQHQQQQQFQVLAQPPQQQQQPSLQQQQSQQQTYHYSCKKRISIYMRREIARFFGVESSSEAADFMLWYGRQQRLAIRRFGLLKTNQELEYNGTNSNDNRDASGTAGMGCRGNQRNVADGYAKPPDILPARDAQYNDITLYGACRWHDKLNANHDYDAADYIERKATVVHMLITGISYVINIFNTRLTNKISNRGCTSSNKRPQWSRSFAPIHVHGRSDRDVDHSDQVERHHQMDIDVNDCTSMIATIIEDELFFDNPSEATLVANTNNDETIGADMDRKKTANKTVPLGLGIDASVGVYMTERHHNGWRTSALNTANNDVHFIGSSHDAHITQTNQINISNSVQNQPHPIRASNFIAPSTNRATRINAQLLDGVLENSRRPPMRRIKYFSVNDLDDRTDHRPFFTYWINTVQIVVLFLSIVCYGIAPIGFGTEQKTGQVLVTSLSLQTVQHVEPRNFWIGPRSNDLVHMGAKFAACMRRDMKIMDVLTKTKRQERETACCIRNDDSGCVQSSQADCSIRGLYPAKSISTWKKWSPGESGPGGRISGSVCGLDPKYCDAPASIAPYEWPDDITKWPICRKTNSFSQRYRYKDHTAEHMVCEVIGHPCCTGLYGECRITTREYCDFVSGYFHEEASLCSQISCLNNVCGMFPFFSVEIPDQFYRLLTSLCMHAGILHLAITLIVQHLFLADLERLIGTMRTAIVYITSGLVGNLTSAVLAPHRPEVGPSASLCGVVSALISLLILMHWKHLHKPYVALIKFILLCTVLFGIGTLPYQLNFAGLLAGVACGAFLTISLVPFTTFSIYERKKKINLIWTCIIFHLLVYVTLIATFYIYPSEFSTLNIVEDIFDSATHNYISPTNNNIGHHNHNGEVVGNTQRYSQTQSQYPQYFYHPHSEIIRNSVDFTEGDTSFTQLLHPAEMNRQEDIKPWPERAYTRLFGYNKNYSIKNTMHSRSADGIIKDKGNFNSSLDNIVMATNHIDYKLNTNLNITKIKGL
ncbi:inactive rhomboid protein 1 [Drosophila nasuta]|uniref:inactive rhomboid protein 1 n=1 Tax=Drosophila nasuta TaxID=42062 RepID=UPI00295EE1F0|nr:inactive rhomboid protein 1 [Drosophila nasuta]XP_060661157.1 inactive rhomboid protein 1 [Drosophila nasuta]